jgi:hypothetical protein
LWKPAAQWLFGFVENFELNCAGTDGSTNFFSVSIYIFCPRGNWLEIMQVESLGDVGSHLKII